MAAANTARHAFDLIKDDYPELVAKVGREIVKVAAGFGNHRLDVRTVIFGFDGKVKFDSIDT